AVFVELLGENFRHAMPVGGQRGERPGVGDRRPEHDGLTPGGELSLCVGGNQQTASKAAGRNQHGLTHGVFSESWCCAFRLACYAERSCFCCCCSRGSTPKCANSGSGGSGRRSLRAYFSLVPLNK